MRTKTHPGEILREDFMIPLDLSANALTTALRVPATRIGEIIKGHRSITADTALRLARYLGTTPQFWLNLQSAHDLSKVAAETGEKIAQDVTPRAA